MDVTIGSLCSGIGGLELGIERAVPGSRVIWQVERDPFCRRVLAKHWPGACRDVDDLQRAERLWATCRGDTFTTGRLAPCDVLCAGFPCQDLSVAGKGAGLDGARSGLFWDVLRIVRAIRPRVVVLENVAALVTRGLDVVLGALASCGYDAVWDCIPAAAIGAPHRRDRVFVVAWRVSDADCKSLRFKPERARATDKRNAELAHVGGHLANAAGERAQADHAHCGTTGAAISRCSGDSGTRGTLAHSDAGRCGSERSACLCGQETEERHDANGCDLPQWPPAPGDLHAWRAVPVETQPAVCRVAYGVPAGMDAARLRALGNAVVPQVAEVVGAVVREVL